MQYRTNPSKGGNKTTIEYVEYLFAMDDWLLKHKLVCVTYNPEDGFKVFQFKRDSNKEDISAFVLMFGLSPYTDHDPDLTTRIIDYFSGF